LGVVLGSLREKFPNSLGSVTALEQRTLPAGSHAAQQHLRGGRKTNKETFLSEQPQILLIRYNATSGRDDLIFPKQNLRQRLLLCFSEMGFAFPAEDLADFHSLALFDDFVEIHETAPEPAGQISPDGAFANRHKARKGDIAGRAF
jgi:hypothetical protein